MGTKTPTPETFYDKSQRWSKELVEACSTLLRTKKFRSSFRQSLRNQLEQWLQDPARQEQYRLPFSPRQIQSLCTIR